MADPAPVPEATLDPPPRRVPLTLQAECLFGGVYSCGWFALFLAGCGLCALIETVVERYMVAWCIVGIVVFTAVTALLLALVVRAVIDGLKERRLLIHGRFAVGRVTGRRGLGPGCSRMSLRVTEDSGEAIEVEATAYSNDLGASPLYRRVLYDPSDPDGALLLDNGGASGPPQLNGKGGFRPPPIGDTLVSLAIPLLILLVPVRGLVMLLITYIGSAGQ